MGHRSPHYYFDGESRFVIENYNWATPFSNFLPGIAGEWGVPVWAYYVSKAQGIISAGVHDKDHAILEFTSFNKACQTVDREGFRTFFRVDSGPVYEPFRKSDDPKKMQQMVVSPSELEVMETCAHLDLETRVIYFPLAGMRIAGLVREVQVRNQADVPRKIEIIDGVPRLLPSGTTFDHTKVIARHIEGVMGVFEVAGIPVFRLKQTPADIAEVGRIDGGNYYLSWMSGAGVLRDSTVVDPAVIFGPSESHDFPWAFARGGIQTILKADQMRQNRTPCAFTALRQTIAPGQSLRLRSLIGHAPSDELIPELVEAVGQDKFFARKREENRNNIDRIRTSMLTVSGSSLFDEYCHQTFLDNVLRGGLPIFFPGEDQDHVFHIYSRQNGDLERDYHWFELEPTYLSQGNGHYRNVIQDRRMDAWFFPRVGRSDVQAFMNLIQLDGYNPLVLNSQTYTANEPDQVAEWLASLGLRERESGRLADLVADPFTPGEFIMALERLSDGLASRRMELLGTLLSMCTPEEIGDIHAGYWIDHWFYNLDLIDTYLMVFPDQRRELLLEDDYTFYDNPDVVQPRDEKLVLTDGGVRQYEAVVRDERKADMRRARAKHACKVRADHGRGDMYRTSLLVKLLCILANRVASLDPRGVGVEMEAGKPGWCDSLNGLPGLLGSSICAALELQRLCCFLVRSLRAIDLPASYEIAIYEELYVFISELNAAIAQRLSPEGEDTALAFWQASHRSIEAYRAAIRFGVSGRENRVTIRWLLTFIQDCLSLLELPYDDSSEKALCSEAGVPYTYFINEVVDYRLEGGQAPVPARGHRDGQEPLVTPVQFEPKPVALFLEGPVHYLRVREDDARSLFRSVKGSSLYDRKLQMFKCCESLRNEPIEIGRIKAHAPGWLENESIYTHMAYKWLLELLRSGSYDLFFDALATSLVPFMDPNTYGRSPVENCSFIAGSAFPDESLRGRAYQPRLSGVTAEMVNMWVIMVAGSQPFYLDDEGQLRFRLRPVLAPWLFTETTRECQYWDAEGGRRTAEIPVNGFGFKLMGHTLTVYHNEKRLPTFGLDGVKPQSYRLTYRSGDSQWIHGSALDTATALDLRRGLIERLDVDLR